MKLRMMICHSYIIQTSSLLRRTCGPCILSRVNHQLGICSTLFLASEGGQARLNFFFLPGLPEPKSVTCLDFLAPVVSLALLKPVTAVAADAGAAAAYYIYL